MINTKLDALAIISFPAGFYLQCIFCVGLTGTNDQLDFARSDHRHYRHNWLSDGRDIKSICESCLPGRKSSW